MKKFLEKGFQKISKEDVIILVVTGVALLCVKYFPMYLVWAVLIFATFNIFYIGMRVWNAVFRSLLFAGAGLSILGLLATTYCDIPDQYRVADESLKNILAFGFVSVVLIFIRGLSIEFFGDKNSQNEFKRKGLIKTEKERNDGRSSHIEIGLMLLLSVYFLWELSRVLMAITSGLCIYRH